MPPSGRVVKPKTSGNKPSISKPYYCWRKSTLLCLAITITIVIISVVLLTLTFAPPMLGVSKSEELPMALSQPLNITDNTINTKKTANEPLIMIASNQSATSMIESQNESPLKPWKKKKHSTDFHFIHIPKCGGTSMTALLREVSCFIDSERNIDCCTNPGFCDWHAMRRCEAIRGCTNHIPNRLLVF